MSYPHAFTARQIEITSLVTNFSEDDRALFEQAVAAYGRDYLVIREPSPRGLPEHVGSLHDLRRPPVRDLSDFWQLWRELKEKADSEAQSTAAVAAPVPA